MSILFLGIACIANSIGLVFVVLSIRNILKLIQMKVGIFDECNI